MPDLTPDQFTRIATLFVPEVVSSITIAPGGRVMAVAAGDKLHIYRVPSCVPAAGTMLTAEDFPRLVTLSMPDKVDTVVFSPDGRLLIAGIADKVHVHLVPDIA